MKSWLFWLWMAQAADITTTVVNTHRGCHEAVWPNASVAVAGKTGATIALTVTLPIFGVHHPTAARSIAGIGIASGATGAVLNLSQRCGR